VYTNLIASRPTRRRAVAFGVLFGLSLVLMAFSNQPVVTGAQRIVASALAPVEGVFTGVGTGVGSVFGAVGEIADLRSENEKLKAENEQLKVSQEQAKAIAAENERLTALLDVESTIHHAVVAGRVIAREYTDDRRVITIDRGTKDGIAEGEVVVAAGGALVGRVKQAGPTYSQIVLINDPSSTVIGELASGGQTGEVVGQLGGALVMSKVDSAARPQIGSQVVTAGIVLGSGIRSPFPKGLIIGEVVDVARDPNAVVQTVFLKPAVDLDSLQLVAVITDYEGGLGSVIGASPSPSPSVAAP
jgi:rod shape-determining protein MreC